MTNLPCKQKFADLMFDSEISYIDYCQLLTTAVVGVDYQPRKAKGKDGNVFDAADSLAYWIGRRLKNDLTTAHFKYKDHYTYQNNDADHHGVWLKLDLKHAMNVAFGYEAPVEFDRSKAKAKINMLIRKPELRNTANSAIDEAKTEYDVNEIVRLAVTESLKKSA